MAFAIYNIKAARKLPDLTGMVVEFEFDIGERGIFWEKIIKRCKGVFLVMTCEIDTITQLPCRVVALDSLSITAAHFAFC